MLYRFHVLTAADCVLVELLLDNGFLHVSAWLGALVGAIAVGVVALLLARRRDVAEDAQLLADDGVGESFKVLDGTGELRVLRPAASERELIAADRELGWDCRRVEAGGFRLPMDPLVDAVRGAR